MNNQPPRLNRKPEYDDSNVWVLIKPSPLMILLIGILLLVFVVIPLLHGSCTEANAYYYHLT